MTDFESSKKEIEAHSIDSDLWLKTASEVWKKILDPLTPVKARPVDPPKVVSEPSPLLISGPHPPPEADPLRADRPHRAPVSFDPFGVGHGDLHGDLPQPFGQVLHHQTEDEDEDEDEDQEMMDEELKIKS